MLGRGPRGHLLEPPDRRKPWLANLRRAIRNINKYSAVGDALVQHQPHVTALIWGTIRFVIQAAAADAELHEGLGDTLAVLNLSARRFEAQALAFADDRTVLEEISILFAHIISYVVRVQAHFSQKSYRRAVKSFSSTALKLEGIYKQIDLRETQLDRHLDAIAHQRQVALTASVEREFQELREFEKKLKKRASQQHVLLKRVEQTICERQSESHRVQQDIKKSLHNHRQDNIMMLKLQDIRDWLRKAVKPSSLGAPEAARQTCQWIYDVDTFRSWLDGDQSQICWISGEPGCGKSVLARSMFEGLRATQPTSFYFCEPRSMASGNQINEILVALLLRIYDCESIFDQDRFPDSLCRLCKLRDIFPSPPLCSTDVLLDVFREATALLPRFRIILDGLDQCIGIDDEQSPLQDFLHGLRALATSTGISVIIFSKRLSCLQQVLEDSCQICISESDIAADIEKFALEELKASSIPRSMTQEILGRIREERHGTFLWTRLLIKRLEAAKTRVKQREILSNVSNQLTAIYRDLALECNRLLRPKDVMRRNKMLLALATAKGPVTLRLLHAFLDGSDKCLNHEDLVDCEAKSLCWPFVRVDDDQIQLFHPTAFDCIRKTAMPDNPDLFLARKCLEKLTAPVYKDWKLSARLLRKHLLVNLNRSPPHCALGEDDVLPLKESILYRYAVLYWQEHVTALVDLPDDVLDLLTEFLTGNETVCWSETLFDLKAQGGVAPQVEVRTSLSTWYAKLPESTQSRIPLESYYVLPHENIKKEFEQKSEDEVLPYLPFIRLGQFFNNGGRTQDDWQRGAAYKEVVALGFEKSLGRRNPLTLQARATMLNEFFFQSKFDEAEIQLADVVSIQAEVLGKDSGDYFSTLALLGYAQYSRTRFNVALSTLNEAASGCKEKFGETSLRYLVTLLYLAYVYDRQGNLTLAKSTYDTILSAWVPIGGQNHLFSIMTRTALSSVQRKFGLFEEPQEALLSVWRQRRHVFGDDLNLTVDPALSLALLYRDAGKLTFAKEMLDSIGTSKVFDADFERYCQIRHFYALIQIDKGYFNMPKDVLQKLLDMGTGENRGKGNRELLWVRFTLAEILRQLGMEDAATMVFSEVVRPMVVGDAEIDFLFDDEPEPPEQLKIAEDALSLVRQTKVEEAESLLQKKRLEWVRPQDFYILQGGPVSDTAVIRSVVSLVVEP